MYIFFDVERLFIKILSPLIEAIASEAVRYTLKTFPKSRINPNCRVIQIVTLFICVGAVLAPCRACDCVGTRPAPTTEFVTLGVRSLLLGAAPLSLPQALRMARGLYFVFLIY